MLKATNVSKGNCDIYRFNCNGSKIPSQLRTMIELGHGQKSAFVDIFPWEDYLCSSNKVSYVASNKNKVICGWMNIYDEKDSGSGVGGRVFISLLTSRSATDPTYQHIGSSLINVMIKDFSSYNYIYLKPTSKSHSFYDKMGFKPYGSKHYLFKPIASGISKISQDIDELDQSEEFGQILDMLAMVSEDQADKLESLIDDGDLSMQEVIDQYHLNGNIDDVIELIDDF